MFFAPSESGTYYVAAGVHSDSARGTYTLSVTDVTSSITDDFAGWRGTAGTVEVGGSVMGRINYYGDRDWFAVTLEGGSNYFIGERGLRREGGTLIEPYLRGVHDSEGNLIPGTTDRVSGAGDFVGVVFTAREGGTYYVAAGADGHPRDGIINLRVPIQAATRCW